MTPTPVRLRTRIQPASLLLRWLVKMIGQTEQRARRGRADRATLSSLRWLQGSKRPWQRFLDTAELIHRQLEYRSLDEWHGHYWYADQLLAEVAWGPKRWQVVQWHQPVSALQLYALAEELQKLPQYRLPDEPVVDAEFAPVPEAEEVVYPPATHLPHPAEDYHPSGAAPHPALNHV